MGHFKQRPQMPARRILLASAYWAPQFAITAPPFKPALGPRYAMTTVVARFAV